MKTKQEKRASHLRQVGEASRRAALTAHNQELCRLAKAEIDASKQAPTNKQLAKVWPAWNALPAEMSAHQKRRLLLGDIYDRDHSPSANQERKHLAKLRKRFGYLPLRWGEYNQALNAVAEWHKLNGYITANDRPLTADDFNLRETRQRMEAARQYETLGDEAFPGRIALYRVARELRHLRPGFLEKPEPSLADIKHLHERFAAYNRAHLDGVEILSSAIFQRSQSKTDLPFEKQSFGLPNPPPRLPRHLYIARLISLGICPGEKLVEFMNKDFRRLSRRELAQFCKESKDPKLRLYSLLFLWAWLAENAPVFNIFEARWKNIHALVCERFTQDAPSGCRHHPATLDNLKAQWMEFESEHWPGQQRRITPPGGAPRKGERCNIPADFLTPLPRFSTAPKP